MYMAYGRRVKPYECSKTPDVAARKAVKEAVMTIRILLADDHKIVRDGLSVLLEKEPGFEVVATASNGHIACELAQQFQPDIAVLDIGMPVMNGIEATEYITEKFSKVKVVALSMHSDRRFVKSMFAAGASGYLLKDCAFEELTHAIKEITAGRRYISPVLVEDDASEK